MRPAMTLGSALWLAAVVSGLAFTKAAHTLDTAVRARLEGDRVPGLALAVVRGGRIVRTGGYGLANLEWKTPVSAHTKFEIASISKMFAGAAARILIEEHELDPESPVAEFFHGVPASWSTMRVRHLITMSSGLPEDFASDLIPYDQDVATQYDDASMVRAFFGLKMAAPVGARFIYSSPNYAMLGMIVAHVAGKPFPEFVRERIFVPAGMTESSYIDNSTIVPQRAEGYRRTSSGELKKGWYLGQYLHSRPDDGVLTTAGDLARWLLALDRRRIVREPEKMWAPAVADSGRPLDYAYGWIQDTWLGHRRMAHSGGLRTGFHTFVARYPDDDLGIVVLTNCDFSPVRDYVNLIARRFIAGVPDPEALASTADSDPSQTRRSIAAIESVARGAIDESAMYPDAVEPVGLDELAGFLHGARGFRYAGRARLPTGFEMHGHRLVTYDTLAAQLEGRTQFITLYRDASGKIAYLEATN